MPHVEHYNNGVRLVSATEIPSIIDKKYLARWQVKLCHCKTHADAKKTPFKPLEVEALERHGLGHCGVVYADTVKELAADLGNEVHELIERWFKEPDLEWVKGDDEAIMWANKIIEIYKANNVKPYVIQAEENLKDTESNLAGSPDHIITWNGIPAIGDLKIKNQLDELTAMQGCCYRYLLRRKHGVDIKKMVAMWCKKETVGKLVEPVWFDLDEWMDDWYALVKMWNRLNPKRQVILFD